MKVKLYSMQVVGLGPARSGRILVPMKLARRETRNSPVTKFYRREIIHYDQTPLLTMARAYEFPRYLALG